MKIVLINGAPEAGKDTFVQCCINEMGSRCRNFSSVQPAKDIAKICGWDGNKTPEARKFLSDLKQLLSEAPWGDVNLQIISKDIENFYLTFKKAKLNTDNLIGFIHVREPENLDKFKAYFNASTLLIKRLNHNTIISNNSDANVNNYSYDYVIENTTLEKLEEAARVFLFKIFNDTERKYK